VFKFFSFFALRFANREVSETGCA